jgi:hypothetical protein
MLTGSKNTPHVRRFVNIKAAPTLVNAELLWVPGGVWRPREIASPYGIIYSGSEPCID